MNLNGLYDKQLKYINFICLSSVLFISGLISAINPSLTLFLATAVIFIAVCLYNYRKAFILLIFLIPIIPQSLVHVIYTNLGPSQILLDRTLSFIFMLTFLSVLTLRKVEVEWTSYHRVGLVFLISMLLNAMFSAQPIFSFKTILNELWITGLLYFFISFHLTNGTDFLKKLIWAAFSAAVVISIMGFYEVISGTAVELSNIVNYLSPFGANDTIAEWGRGINIRGGLFRAQATLGHSLGMASFFLFLLPLLYEFVSQKANHLPVFLIIAAGLAATQSRAGWFLGCLILSFKFWRKPLLFILIAVVTIIVIVPYYQSAGGEGSNMLLVADADIVRFIRVENAIRVFKANPIFGIGVGQLDLEIFREIKWRSGDVTMAQKLEESGLVGTGAWLFFFIYLITIFIKYSKKEDVPMRNIAFALSLGVIASLLNAVFSNSIFQYSKAYIVMMVLLGSMARIEWDNRKHAV
ncbi:MAG: hypothetical protein GY855_14205 [candidate division Zixibacteria bacterium]|nr:hypothetical protein [candidate division Zixibacteria bacterium]